MQVLGIAGYKNSGKTTLLTRLVRELRARGLRVSTVKHVHHAIDLDRPGKDTFAHREAGAVEVVMLSDARWAILHERPGDTDMLAELRDIVSRLSPVDLVLVEGLKTLPMQRIEIRAPEASDPLPDDGDTIALASDGPAHPRLPTFRRDDVSALADFVGTLVSEGRLQWS
ncbi:MAG: molybdopterin-guanine dinucleotide biosynthesis protein B [Bauldia sp.]